MNKLKHQILFLISYKMSKTFFLNNFIFRLNENIEDNKVLYENESHSFSEKNFLSFD